MTKTTKTFSTERAVFEALRKTYESPAYAVLPGVANGTGTTKTRTIDAVFMSLWPSRGLHLHGVEIKVTRSDFTRELADPKKQEAHFKHMDYFWLAVGDESIVREGELPATWGLLVPARTKLKVIKQAPRLTPEPMPIEMLAAILRRADEHLNSGELRAGIRKEVEAELGDELRVLREQVKTHGRATSMMQHAGLIARFSARSGVQFENWNTEAIDRAADVVKAIGVGAYKQLLAGLRYQAESAKRTAATVNEDADELLVELAKLEAMSLLIADEPDGNAAPPELVEGA
jgi:hypothetical protein